MNILPSLQPIFLILTPIAGIIVGSFLSVVVFRTRKNQKGIFFGRSICPKCKKPLKWYHLFPIFSYIFLRGKCGICKKKIGKQYLGIEVLTAGLFLLAQINYVEIQSFIFQLVLFSFLSMIFVYDALYKEIPDRFSLPIIALAFVYAIVVGTPDLVQIGLNLLIIAVFFGGQILVSKGAWLGGGDLRLGVLMGMVLNTKNMVVALILSYLIGAVFSLILIALKKANRKTAIPFGPFLIIGMIISMFFGDLIISNYLDILKY